MQEVWNIIGIGLQNILHNYEKVESIVNIDTTREVLKWKRFVLILSNYFHFVLLTSCLIIQLMCTA